MRWRLPNERVQARRTLVASACMALTSVGLILATLLVWYPRSVT